MKDEEKIRDVIADELDPNVDTLNDRRRVASDITSALHAAGYTIEPEWSSDMSKAPRDGTPVLVEWDQPGEPDLSVEYLDQFGPPLGAKRWKPISLPQEREE